jgi:phosphonate transport system ATP-binding protein
MASQAVTTLPPPTDAAPVQICAPATPGGLDADIEVAGLCKSFDGKRPVLKDIHLTIPRGQAVALIGHNGSGKSTLLRSCLQLIKPSSGTVRVLGSEMTSLSHKRLRRMRSQVGFVFQRHNLVSRLSVLSNVLHGVQARRKGPQTWFHCLAPQKERQAAMAQLQRVGLTHLANRRVDQLSGGESQRVAIARALMQQPKIMMADEPVASLDPNAGEEVMQLFLNLIRDQGLTLLFVSHNLEHALRYADRIIGLRQGCVELDQPSESSNVLMLRRLYE